MHILALFLLLLAGYYWVGFIALLFPVAIVLLLLPFQIMIDVTQYLFKRREQMEEKKNAENPSPSQAKVIKFRKRPRPDASPPPQEGPERRRHPRYPEVNEDGIPFL